MKKFLLSAAMLLLGAVATFAQEWTIGQEIEGVIQNPSFTIPASEDIKWQYVNASGPTVEQLFESWNSGTETQVFQYVQLPKGKYRLTCQGYYRGGGENEDYNNFISDWKDYAWLFVQNGEYKDGDFTGAHIFKNPLMPRLFELVEEQIYFGVEGDADWAIDHSHQVGDKTVWAPGGVNGSVAWFNAGKYMPYEKDDIIYNIVDFFLPQDGYVKLGSMKTGSQAGGDTFFMTNVKLYYEGQPSEEEIYNLAQDDLQDLYDQLEKIQESYDNGFIAIKLQEVLEGEIKDTYGYDPEEMDMESVMAATAACQELLENVTKAINDMNTMNGTISSIEGLLNTTDKPGKAALQAAVDAAKKLTTDEYEYDEADDWNIFEKQNQALNEARLAYMNSGESSEYPKDYTSFINFPWFCNPEFEPTWNAEEQKWVANEAALATEWASQDDIDSTEDGWYTDNQGKKIVITETNFLADKVYANAWTNDQNSVGKWYQVNNGLVLYWNDYLTCVKKWDTPHTDNGVREIAQNIVNLPSGFYKLKALGQTWSADWDNGEKLCKSCIYLKAGEQISESEYLPIGGWWGKDINQWQELETDFVQVTNGELKIAAHDNGFVAWTGFRLFYYGETPDFDGMLKPNFDAAKDDADNLAFNGDRKIAEDLLSKIPAHITSSEVYLKAQEDLKAATDYINKAKAATGANWKAPDNFMNLATAKEGDVADFLNKAWDATWDLEDSEDAVYTDAIYYDNLYKAYESYVNFRESLGKYLDDPAVAAVVTEQNDYLKATVATEEKLEEFKNVLGIPVNIARFKEKGSDNATLDNPIDVTFMLQNPKFHEGHSKGWDCVKGNGTFTNDNLGIEFAKDENENEKLYKTISEIWGASDPFTVSQTLNGLPAGTYEIRTHTLYRDGWGPDQAEFEQYVSDEEFEGDDPNWNFKNNHAKVFAEGANGQYRQETPVSYIYSLRINEPSFLYHSAYDWYEYDDVDKQYNPLTVEYLADYADDLTDFLATLSEEQLTYKSDYEGRAKGSHTAVAMNAIPFDKKLTIEVIDPDDDMPVDVDYFFSQRTIGLVYAVKADYNNYLKKLYINLPEGGTLTLGIDKEQGGGGSSLAMYDWELFYCGTEIPTAIDAITEAGEGAGEGAVEYYSVNGVKLSAPQKGINIIKTGSTVKKVYIQ